MQDSYSKSSFFFGLFLSGLFQLCEPWVLEKDFKDHALLPWKPGQNLRSCHMHVHCTLYINVYVHNYTTSASITQGLVILKASFVLKIVGAKRKLGGSNPSTFFTNTTRHPTVLTCTCTPLCPVRPYSFSILYKTMDTEQLWMGQCAVLQELE